ncbi:dihydrofolate reductase [Methyloraptor flagellatus]|uniref:Dihydrofolate reductase n=1 Tax=Methyloraptor flagellatus TaxID=3162530 RepID=A0AAU7XAZ6_9HYPH
MSTASPAPIEIVIVVAVAKNGVIGRENDMPWRISTDFKRFRRITMGRPIIMGRKTFLSIGKPLDGRTNIVVTRDPVFRPEGAEVAASLDLAIERAKAVAAASSVGEIMIGGGGEIYRQALPLATRVELTEVALEPPVEGAAVFPTLDPAAWQEVARVAGERGPKDEADFAFVTYRRR